MRFIPTQLHGVLDYVVGLLVIALPYLLGIEGTASVALIGLGLVAIGYSLLTDYELGLVRFLRLRFHLALDAAFGIAMLLLPIALTVPANAQWPIYTVGVLALALVATTQIRATGTAA